ncbi:COP9 signalosome complex subunit 5 [Intoshia linei]|uniref:COP9 signalosome complex subunit 5 n=1 Tax=Intoshia linei TaxID=1819745 RepID=A0A177BBA8_9BILA|nr:COP9 signalosome complex subunit 5 [Intoshia linei]
MNRFIGLNSDAADANQTDTAETIYISSLALLKMLKHGRAGVPMEVMGLMVGDCVDEFTIYVADVFAMPQSGTGVSVEAVDPVFQSNMLEMLAQTGRAECVVGWYHSHPGFGCWLSGVDINTQQSFESLSERAVAVVIDPIQSVKGKVVIDAFRSINNTMVITSANEPRQTTSNIGHLTKPTIQALIHGLNRSYYSMPIKFLKEPLEETMLLNLSKKTWMDGLKLENYQVCSEKISVTLKKMLSYAKSFKKELEEEENISAVQRELKNIGKMDPKRHLMESINDITNNTGGIDNNVFYKMRDKYQKKDRVGCEHEIANTLVSTTDYEPAKKKQAYSHMWLVAVSFLCSFVSGIGCCFTSPTLATMIEENLLYESTAPWYTSLLSIGAIFGGPLTGHVLNKYGRKPCIFIVILFFAICWFFTISAEFIKMPFIVLYISRFIFGLGFSMLLLAFPTYLNESVYKSQRGWCSSSVGIGIGFGILLVYSVGNIISWQYISLIAIIILIPALLLALWIPESPRWLIRHGKLELGYESLLWLRQCERQAEEEKSDIFNSVQMSDGIKMFKDYSELKNKKLIKNFAACLAIHAIQQLSLINVILSYSTGLLNDAGFSNTTLPLIFIGIVQLFSGMLSATLLDRFGRRPLVLASSTLIMISLASMGIYFHFICADLISQSYKWIVLVIITFYFISYNMGIGNIPWIVMSELLVCNLQEELSTLITFFNWMFSFLVTISYPYLDKILAKHSMMYIFATFVAGCLLVTVLILPETKGKSLEDMKLNYDEEIK